MKNGEISHEDKLIYIEEFKRTIFSEIDQYLSYLQNPKNENFATLSFYFIELFRKAEEYKIQMTQEFQTLPGPDYTRIIDFLKQNFDHTVETIINLFEQTKLSNNPKLDFNKIFGRLINLLDIGNKLGMETKNSTQSF